MCEPLKCNKSRQDFKILVWNIFRLRFNYFLSRVTTPNNCFSKQVAVKTQIKLLAYIEIGRI